MWRNLKISCKLLLGFGLMLAAFLVAIAITWDDIDDTRSDSKFLATGVVPAMTETANLERDLYAFSLQVMQMRFEESDQSIANVKAGQAKIQKLLEDISEFSAAHPDLEATRRVSEKVLPIAVHYLNSVEKTISASIQKSALDSAMQKAGKNMYALANDTLNDLHTTIKEELQIQGSDKVASLLDLLPTCVQTVNDIQNLQYSIQTAMVAALEDRAHVAAQRALYGRRRAVLLEAVTLAGYLVEGSEAGLYLWFRAPGGLGGQDGWATVADLASLGILVAPGEFYGEAGRPFVRMALTATDAAVAEAAARLSGA
jgi:hypothetical protein